MPPARELAAYASAAASSRGRRHAEPPTRDRDDFQRDRDRIVHSTAFRRLVYKTQVFVNHEGDLFRTRLTHSLEVAQLGRSIARSLQLNEDLVEALALAHDLGHTPFGHAGQDALHECMDGQGGFEHNLQSLRVVDVLEARYAAFDGLNLCFETREGILKHCSRRDAQALEAAEPGGVGRRFLDGTRPSLEAQLTDLADAIAYNAHDLDDGVRSGLITLDQAAELPLVREHRDAVLAQHPRLATASDRRLLHETIRRMLSAQVHDVIDASSRRLQQAAPADAAAVRGLPRLIGFSDAMHEQSQALKRWLFQALYRHPQVNRTTAVAKEVVRELFAAYVAQPQQMRPDFAARPDRHRAVADYVAGMTDRFATREHRRLTGGDPFGELQAAAQSGFGAL
ncbi:MAG: deoxyguanosinetriphosphate triphosphohydrolase [Burkholderiaceae bacterium]|nr:deoxyguanosinetriphosphate triphosphohydrolase [Burkholderiaceae bacterium]